MKHKLFALITILLIPALLAACVATSPAAPATAPAESAAQAENGCGAGFRPIDHDYGTTCVPENPQRIAVTDIDIAAFMRVLGIQPVALDFAQWHELVAASPEWSDAGAAFTADAVDLGEWPYNLEVLTAAQPDLILAAGVEDYALLNQIAPTVAFNIYDNNEDRWATFTEFFGNVLNAGDETQALIDATDERIAALGDYLQTEAGDPTVSVFASPDGNIYYGAPYFAYNQVLAQAGIARPAAQAVTQAEYDTLFDIYWATVSLEKLDTLDADYLLMLDYGNPDAVTALADEPIWQALQAVQNARFFTVPGQQWLSFDIYSINKTLDNLFTIVGNVDPAEVAPNPFLTTADAPANPTTTAESIDQIAGFPPYAPAQPLLEEVVSHTADTIVVKHAYGETAIPANPQRIYVNDPATLQILLSLGIEPVGSAVFTPELPPAMQEAGTAVTLLQDMGEGVNLEGLAALQPDLILGHAKEGPGMISADQYATFSQLAPTVAFTGNPFFYWKAATRDLGDFFGVPDKAAAVLADYEAQLADSRAQAQAALGNETVTILLLFDTTMWLYSVGGNLGGDYIPLSPTSWAYRELGLTPGPEVAALAGEELWAEISLELIPELKADHLVVFPNAYGGEEIGQGLDDYFDSPLWQTVPAVQNGKVHVLTADNAIEGYWTTPYLIEAFLATLDQ
ncbi:MAG: ABC transporter substrate-binding protein [Caldilineaceae bacterium]